MGLGYGERGLGIETLPGPPQTQHWAQNVLVIIQSRGCTCTFKLSSDNDLMIHAKLDCQFLLCFGD
jgi:hypothetical protein